MLSANTEVIPQLFESSSTNQASFFLTEAPSPLNDNCSDALLIRVQEKDSCNETFKGIDGEDCIYKTFDFACASCNESIDHKDIYFSRSQTFNSSGNIQSNANILSKVALTYYAKDSIILKPGFSVGPGAEFTVDIDDCN